MALRSTPALTVPSTGPRSRTLAAPQAIGNRVGAPPRPGWEVSRIWPERLLFVIVLGGVCRPKSEKPPADACRTRGLRCSEYGAKSPENQAFAAATSARASLPISAGGRPGL
jgi:hypothetical protein